MVMNILSIQSAVAYGHVGNSAAVFPLQRLGHEVWPVYTVNYSNHTGYGSWKGPIIPADDVRAIIEGIGERGQFRHIDTIISGYQGGPEIVDVIVDSVKAIKAENPNALYSCDPVMGNEKSGCFVPDTIPPLIRDKALPVADIITPNQFELGYMTGRSATDLASTLDAVEAARDLGPRTVLVTSVLRPDRKAGTVEMLVVDDHGRWMVETPYLPHKFNGSGDVTAALFAGHYSATRDGADALARTASAVYDLIETTYQAEAKELLLIDAQDYYANPRLQFTVREV